MIKTVRIVFDLPGDDIGGQESQAILNRIRDEIVARHLAEMESSGFGMGTMELVLRLGKGGSVEELRRTIQDIHPEGRYRIEERNH